MLCAHSDLGGLKKISFYPEVVVQIWLDPLWGFLGCWATFIKKLLNSFMPFLASEGCFLTLAATMRSEVKKNYAHVKPQWILNKFCQKKFSVGCLVWSWLRSWLCQDICQILMRLQTWLYRRYIIKRVLYTQNRNSTTQLKSRLYGWLHQFWKWKEKIGETVFYVCFMTFVLKLVDYLSNLLGPQFIEYRHSSIYAC